MRYSRVVALQTMKNTWPFVRGAGQCFVGTYRAVLCAVLGVPLFAAESVTRQFQPPPGRIAPGVFSLKLDGSEHEGFAVGGTANPVEVASNDEGEVFGTIAILDRVDGQRNDSLMHWIYGGIYPHNPNDPVPLKRTGPDLPALSRVGQVPPAGLDRYRSAVFGPEFRGDIFWFAGR